MTHPLAIGGRDDRSVHLPQAFEWTEEAGELLAEAIALTADVEHVAVVAEPSTSAQAANASFDVIPWNHRVTSLVPARRSGSAISRRFAT